MIKPGGKQGGVCVHVCVCTCVWVGVCTCVCTHGMTGEPNILMRIKQTETEMLDLFSLSHEIFISLSVCL